MVEFEDNRLLPELYGEHGRNLVRIEQTLDISIANRGNQVYLTGPEDACRRAEPSFRLTGLLKRQRRQSHHWRRG